MAQELEFTPEEIEEGKSLAWLAYLGVFFLIPMLVQKGNRFSLFHVRQGVVLFAINLLLVFLMFTYMAFKIMLQIMDADYLLCCFDTGMGVLQMAIAIFLLVMTIIGIIKALSGEAWEMPVIGQIAQKLEFIK